LVAAETVPERRGCALEDTVGAEDGSQGQALAATADRACLEMNDSALLRFAQSGDPLRFAQSGDPLRFAQSGDPRALEELCRRGWKPVYRSLARFTRDPAEAEDLTHEVFLRARCPGLRTAGCRLPRISCR
jgi:hypothetical protein